MNTAAALLAAIREHPDDDTPRLAYADCIQEDGEDDRAELIRVQCKLATFGPRPPMCKRTGKKNGWECPGCRSELIWQENTDELRTRERDLLLRHPEWRPVCVRCSGSGWQDTENYVACQQCGGMDLKRGTGRIGEHSRGWLHCVRVPRLVDVWEEVEVETPCPHCRNKLPNWETGVVECRTCDGSGSIGVERKWQPTPWALALVREHPLLAEVVCEDRRPNQTAPSAFYWYLPPVNEELGTAMLPPPVFAQIKNGKSLGGVMWEFPTASDALAVAQVAALRRFL